MLTRIRKTRPQKDAATLPHKKKSEEKNRKNTTISNFAGWIDAPSPLVGRIFESARNYATPPSFSPGAADRAQNEKNHKITIFTKGKWIFWNFIFEHTTSFPGPPEAKYTSNETPRQQHSSEFSNTHQKKSKISKIFNFSECHHKVLKWSPLSVFEPGNGFYLKFFAFLLGVASSGARARPHEAEPNRRFEEKSKNTHTPLGNLNEKIRKSGYTEF